MDTDVLLIEIPWPAGLPAGLLDIAESLSLHECHGFLESTQQDGDDHTRLH